MRAEIMLLATTPKGRSPGREKLIKRKRLDRHDPIVCSMTWIGSAGSMVSLLPSRAGRDSSRSTFTREKIFSPRLTTLMDDRHMHLAVSKMVR